MNNGWSSHARQVRCLRKARKGAVIGVRVEGNLSQRSHSPSVLILSSSCAAAIIPSNLSTSHIPTHACRARRSSVYDHCCSSPFPVSPDSPLFDSLHCLRCSLRDPAASSPHSMPRKHSHGKGRKKNKTTTTDHISVLRPAPRVFHSSGLEILPFTIVSHVSTFVSLRLRLIQLTHLSRSYPRPTPGQFKDDHVVLTPTSRLTT